MASAKKFDIDIPAEPLGAVEVRLVGVEYLAKTPKAALALSLLRDVQGATNDPVALLEVISSWLEMAFGTEVRDSILARLNDPGDALDIPHITRLMQALTEKATATPTT